MDAQNVLEKVGVEMARKKAEIRHMARWLSTKKIALKRKKEEIERIRRVNKLIFAENRHKQKIVEDFLAAVEAENTDPEISNISTENAVGEVIQGMNDLNLLVDNIYITVSQVQPFCSSDSASNRDNN